MNSIHIHFLIITITGLHKMLKGFEDKTAYALCTFAYCSGDKDAKVHVFEGRCDGSIVEPRGPTDFGWDPIFQPSGYTETYAEMDKSIKNTISHRFKSVTAVKEFFLDTKKASKRSLDSKDDDQEEEGEEESEPKSKTPKKD